MWALRFQDLSLSELCENSLGPQALVLLAGAIKFMAASVEVVILDDNPIGAPNVSLKPEATSGVAITQGVFAEGDRRFGEVTDGPDSDKEVKMQWIDGDNSEKTHPLAKPILKHAVYERPLTLLCFLR